MVQGGGTTYYVNENYEVINGEPVGYIFASNLRIGKVTVSDTNYFHKGHLGSSTVMTDDTGTPVEASEYMPFGHLRDHIGAEVSDYKFTDQGDQFTSKSFRNLLKQLGIKISMDVRGLVQDNIFFEHLWWTVKYHYLYLHAFDNGTKLRIGLNEWFKHYNQERSHQALDNLTPDEVYYNLPHLFAEAA